jgi:hypothetical protein
VTGGVVTTGGGTTTTAGAGGAGDGDELGDLDARGVPLVLDGDRDLERDLAGRGGAHAIRTGIDREVLADQRGDVGAVALDGDAGRRLDPQLAQPGLERGEPPVRVVDARIAAATRELERVAILDPGGRGAAGELVAVGEVEQRAELRIVAVAGLVERASLDELAGLLELLRRAERGVGGDLVLREGGARHRDEGQGGELHGVSPR